jgi:nucleoside-diphosphate-sugar epimerase
MTIRLLILGGTGPAGRAIVHHLRSGGGMFDLTVVSRTAVHVPGVDRVITGHYADLARAPEFRNRLQTSSALLHLGDGLGVLQQRTCAADGALADRLVADSKSVTSAVREAQVPLFVYVSSIKALCDEEDERVLVETSQPQPTTLYGLSKLRLEKAVESALAGSQTRHVILRNPVMYGEGNAGSLHRLLKLADTPLPLPLAGLDNRRSVLAMRNFASALAAVMQAGPNARSGIFHVHDGPPVSTTLLVEAMRSALGRPARLFPVGAAASRISRHAPLLGAAARRLYGSLELSDACFRDSFAWSPVIDTRAAIAEFAQHSLRRA